MRVIDGGHGEGGGQLVRNAVALAAITRTPIRLVDIRARRTPPGLAPQHVAAIRAVAALSQATVEGLEPRSTEIVFRPGAMTAGEFTFDVGTAGSLMLVLQAVLPVALHAPARVQARLIGGTDVRAAPPFDYFAHVMQPLLVRLGVNVRVDLERRGYYPRGGGTIVLTTEPSMPRPWVLTERGRLRALAGRAHCSNLPRHIAERMAVTAQTMLAAVGPADIRVECLDRSQAVGPGGAIVLWARTDHALLGAAAVAERGVPAERIAGDAAQELLAELASGATLDRHAADQLLLYLALAGGQSAFIARELTSHARTTLWLLEQFLPLSWRAVAVPGGERISLSTSTSGS